MSQGTTYTEECCPRQDVRVHQSPGKHRHQGEETFVIVSPEEDVHPKDVHQQNCVYEKRVNAPVKMPFLLRGGSRGALSFKFVLPRFYIGNAVYLSAKVDVLDPDHVKGGKSTYLSCVKLDVERESWVRVDRPRIVSVGLKSPVPVRPVSVLSPVPVPGRKILDWKTRVGNFIL